MMCIARVVGKICLGMVAVSVYYIGAVAFVVLAIPLCLVLGAAMWFFDVGEEVLGQ